MSNEAEYFIPAKNSLYLVKEILISCDVNIEEFDKILEDLINKN